VVERLTGRELTDGNSLSILQCGDEAYPEMLSAIRNARQSIALASYIFRVDDVGRAFIAELAEARSRGVEIRVLIDGIGGRYMFSPIARELKRHGIPVARFLHHWLPWRMPFLNMRSHKKILVVDGTIGFTGGINIGRENVLASEPQNPVYDVHFRVDGPVVRHIMMSFAEDWKFTTAEALEGEKWWPEFNSAGSVLGRGISSGPDESVGLLESVLATAVAAATYRLRIVTPYFLPDERLMAEIELAVLRGVEVDLILPERSDNALLDWATRADIEALAAQAQIYLSPIPFDHAKLMTIDGQWCLVGSANWDVRSTRLNFEFSLECYNETAVGEIDRLIDMRIKKSCHLSSEELAMRSLPIRLRDAAARLLMPYL
jgi:cardiolipin synthase